MLDYHVNPLPNSCDVCRYAVQNELDCAYEHARARVALVWLLQDLQSLEGESASLSSLAVESVGIEPGPVHPLEPRHWYWAMFYSPEIRISLKNRDDS